MNRFDKVFLINPPVGAHYGALRPPAGLGYIAQTLWQHGVEYKVLDMLLGYRYADLRQKIAAFNPRVIGLTMFTIGYQSTYTLIRKLKEDFPQILIIVGGPHVSTMRNQVLEECKEIDLGMVMESEETWIELCGGENIKDIKGIIYRNNGRVISNGEREFVEDLDQIPFPRYEKFELDRYIKERVIVSSRGCPYNCIYCPVSLTIGKKLRMRSPKSVVEEIAYWYKRRFNQFNFVDDNFTFHKDRVYGICDEIIKKRLDGLFLRLSNGVRADKVDKDLLKRMREVGFRQLAFGVEAGNDKVLRRLRKGEKINQISQAIEDACNLGYDVYLFFLVGSLGETWTDLVDSVNLALKYPISRVCFYNIIPYPKTPLFDWLWERGYFVESPESYLNSASSEGKNARPVFITPELNLHQRKRALRYTRKIERRVLRASTKRMLRELNIPGIVSDLIGYFASRDIIQRLLFKNIALRKVAEGIRFKAKCSTDKVIL
jgi:radical SAM superfamily enzyme YgiQ (UPF0313 family)